MMFKVSDGQDPYNAIGKYIRDHITVIEDMIAVIRINEVETNQLFTVDMNEENYFIWENDWWEGEEDVTLIDFFPVSEAQHANQSAQSADTISRQAAINEVARWIGYLDEDMITRIQIGLKRLPPAQPETYKEKLNEIASALSEKFAYMNTCFNERDIILGYLGVKRSCETHCYTDCTNTKCESHPSFAQQELPIRCGDCKYKDDGIDEDGFPFLKCLHGRSYGGTRINDFCSWAERKEGEADGQR